MKMLLSFKKLENQNQSNPWCGRLVVCAVALLTLAHPFSGHADAETEIQTKTAKTTQLHPKVGEPAPDFHIKDTHGKEISLEKFRGKYIVLEWHNPGCPYVKKHYETKNMQHLQKEWTKKGKDVIWLSINSSAKGKEGAMTAKEANEEVSESGASPTATILDHAGDIGHLYEAKTTPHMFVIDPTGKLIYEGAIDDKNSTDKEDVKTAKNYVAQALTESMAGNEVSEPTTPPYGCGVKY